MWVGTQPSAILEMPVWFQVLRFIGEMGESMGCLPFSSLIASISHRVIAPILAYILVLLFFWKHDATQLYGEYQKTPEGSLHKAGFHGMSQGFWYHCLLGTMQMARGRGKALECDCVYVRKKISSCYNGKLGQHQHPHLCTVSTYM